MSSGDRTQDIRFEQQVFLLTEPSHSLSLRIIVIIIMNIIIMYINYYITFLSLFLCCYYFHFTFNVFMCELCLCTICVWYMLINVHTHRWWRRLYMYVYIMKEMCVCVSMSVCAVLFTMALLVALSPESRFRMQFQLCRFVRVCTCLSLRSFKSLLLFQMLFWNRFADFDVLQVWELTERLISALVLLYMEYAK